MKQFSWLAMLMLTAVQTPQVNTGVIAGRVLSPKSSDGISDVQITLVGPSPVASLSSLGSLYTPNPALTPAMREQIDILINAAPPTVSLETVANAAIRQEAQLLGLPVPTLQNPAPAPPPQTGVTTDREGAFVFRNLAPGRYQIRAQRDGYFATPAPGATPVGATTIGTTTVTVVAGQPTPPVSMLMLRGAIISGRVRDPNGQPLQSVQIGAFQVDYQNGRKMLRQVNSKQTDDRGEYRLFWLPPGDYVMATTPRRLGRGAPGPQDTQARTFYPNVLDSRSAQPIHAAEGAEVSGIDINVRPDATGKISGRIVTSLTGPNGQPAVGTFYLLATDSSALSDTGLTTIANTAVNGTTGQFELRGLVPGQYELFSTVSSNGTQGWGRTHVSVTSGELTDVVLNVHPGVAIKARLTVDGAAAPYTLQAAPARGGFDAPSLTAPAAVPPGTPVPTPTYRIQLRSAEGSIPAVESTANQNVSFDPSGVFVFPNVPEGKYTVAVTPFPPTAYIADVKVGGTSVFDSGLDINSQTAEIQVLLNTTGVKIQGRVLDAAQKPFASARVTLVPRETRRQNAQLYRVVSADASGNFTVYGVAPGEYKLFAWENVPNTAWMNAEFMVPYESRGSAITVSENGSSPATLDLKIIPRE